MKIPKLVCRWAVMLAFPLGILHGAEAPVRRPNILHIHADDHRSDGLHALGTPWIHTPNLDALVERGMTFTRCYTMGSMSGAVCQPSRTMMLTGKSWLRIPGPKVPLRELDASGFLPRVISSAGYQTFHVGKGNNEFTPGLESYDKNVRMDDHTPVERRGSSERHADAVIQFLDERDRQKPFYVYLAPPVPHDPRVTAPDFHQRYRAAEVPLPVAFLPMHPFNNGDMTVRDEKLAPWPRTPEDTRQQLADYYACVTGLDYHVGRVMERLRKEGHLEDTVVVFSGDNGLSLGEHGLFGKQNLYEFGGMHVPLVMAGPGIPRGKSEALVYLMDLLPTFAQLAGAAVPPGVEGKSLMPVVVGSEKKVRDALYTAYKECQRAVRDDRWKLIRYPLVDVTQLFDLELDPHELTNLAHKPEHAGKLRDMLALLAGEMRKYGDEAPLQVPNPAPSAWSPPAPLSE